METIREVVKRRDNCDDAAVDELFEAAGTEFSEDSSDPEYILEDIFGLEPDYLFDAEFQAALETA